VEEEGQARATIRDYPIIRSSLIRRHMEECRHRKMAMRRSQELQLDCKGLLKELGLCQVHQVDSQEFRKGSKEDQEGTQGLIKQVSPVPKEVQMVSLVLKEDSLALQVLKEDSPVPKEVKMVSLVLKEDSLALRVLPVPREDSSVLPMPREDSQVSQVDCKLPQQEEWEIVLQEDILVKAVVNLEWERWPQEQVEC
jgi:hypothetical protein